MKAFTILAVLTASALAAPTTPAPENPLDARNLNKKCPPNKVQPDGKLPKGSIPASILVPISKKQPKKTFPQSDWAKVTPDDYCTIFNLDLPAKDTQGKICNLVFDFPGLLEAPGLWTFKGPGNFDFTGYAVGAGAIPGKTSYENQPPPGPSPPSPPPFMKPGNSYIINSGPCQIPPEAGVVTVSGSLCSKDTTLIFKQSDKKCPLGFYVILTDDPDYKPSY
ncbi:hypothetical protein BS50DRAFT_356509 [Corynespora cassiicola Philippines]|uniref:Ubiquitin 3 binding protein But2 C-terminal domain-containing protein n=1 Tax=Corynespora cassiicola Philippines TaxID=1448308 RepID=A0A2T2NRJ7_CORCC|nr:hypothetical protein BS50DRAFT_356509 [Corynespora cassiicola Philippines]